MFGALLWLSLRALGLPGLARPARALLTEAGVPLLAEDGRPILLET